MVKVTDEIWIAKCSCGADIRSRQKPNGGCPTCGAELRPRRRERITLFGWVAGARCRKSKEEQFAGGEAGRILYEALSTASQISTVVGSATGCEPLVRQVRRTVLRRAR